MQDLPDDVPLYLLASRYWEVDSELKDIAGVPRIGRVPMARGRDAADVALTTTFGLSQLDEFTVWADEIAAAAPGS